MPLLPQECTETGNKYLIHEKPDAIINIVDGTNLERNLYLSTQIMELGIPVVMAVNMMDVVEKRGDKINIAKLSEKLGCEVVEISALKGTGIMKAAEKAVAIAREKKVPELAYSFSDSVESAIHQAEELISSKEDSAQQRFLAVKLLEKDEKIADLMKNVPDVSEIIIKFGLKFFDDL